jgi:hypothetical protein
MGSKAVAVFSLDDHEKHVEMHSRLLSTPWLRTDHIMAHMQHFATNQAESIATNAPMQPGQQQTQPSRALGHMPTPEPQGANPQAQQSASQAGTGMPAQPGQPAMPTQK